MVARRLNQDPAAGRREVGHWVALEVTPDHLHRIQIGSVGRQEVAVQRSIALEELVDDLRFVSLRTIPYNEQRFLELSAQVPQEPHDPPGREVRVREQGKVKSYPIPAYRDCERRDG